MRIFEAKHKTDTNEIIVVLDKTLIDGKTNYLIADAHNNLKLMSEQTLLDSFQFIRTL